MKREDLNVGEDSNIKVSMGLFRKLGRIPEEGPSFRVETSCSIKRLLENACLLLN